MKAVCRQVEIVTVFAFKKRFYGGKQPRTDALPAAGFRHDQLGDMDLPIKGMTFDDADHFAVFLCRERKGRVIADHAVPFGIGVKFTVDPIAERFRIWINAFYVNYLSFQYLVHSIQP